MNSDLELFSQLAKIVLSEEKINPVTKSISPEQLFDKLDIRLDKEGLDEKKLFSTLKDILSATPKTSSSLFFNQLFGGRHSKAVLGDLLSILLNNTMATYKVSGPQAAIEKEIINKVAGIIGYENAFGGTFPTGGSMSNFMSLIMARDKTKPFAKQKGGVKNLVLYTSENAHYSVAKNTAFSGIGKDNIRYINSNFKGEMSIRDLKNQIQKDTDQGLIPFYINATSGTTVLGAFDAIDKIAEISKEHNMWLHVDGSYSGTAIFSKKYKKLLEGVQLSDSFCFNAHKTLGTPLSCSVLLVKNKQYLYNSFDNEASYLYQTHHELDEFNLGKTSFECGRRNNALKFWVLWKSIGALGISRIVDQGYDLANYAQEYVEKNPDYRVYSHSNTLSVCFNYKNYEPIDLCTKLYESNTIMVGYGSFKEDTFIRLVVVNASNDISILKQFFSILEKFVKNNCSSIKKVNV